MSTPEKRTVRTLFLSDLHLGTRNCKSNHLLSFLDHVEAERIYLVGDVLDMIELQRRIYWPDSHNEILQRLLERARNGTEVIYVPGNHDSAFRRHLDLSVCSIRIEQRTMHELRDGRRLLVMHGDEIDPLIRPRGAVAWFGDRLYAALMRLDLGWDWVGQQFGRRSYWSLAGYLKRHSERAARTIAIFENGARNLAREAGADGVVCGHIHRPAVDRSVEDCIYVNCGDWVESCSAVVESLHGTLEVVHWESTERRGDALEPAIPLRAPRELTELALSQSIWVA